MWNASGVWRSWARRTSAATRSAAALWGAEDPDALLAWGPDYVVRSPDEVVALAASG